MRVKLSQMTADGFFEKDLSASPITDRDEVAAVNVYADIKGRTFEGLGGAATEAAAHTYFQMNEARREELLSLYFGGGADYRFLRVSLDSCDFSIGHYEAMGDESDRALASFSLSHDELEVIPFIKAAQKKAGRAIPLLLSPWSPPAYMKTNGERNHGGKLKPEYAPMWAEYMCRYIEGYQSHGLTVRFVSVQNEPNATQRWDSCVYSPEDERLFVRDHLSPALKRHGLDTQIFIWDHNKERVYERACKILTEDVRDLVGGVAFHIYTGDHFEALRYTLDRFPEKTLMFSEGCMSIRGDRYTHALRYAHEYIGDLREGATILIDWNLILDEQGGPNHVQNFCSAPVMCNAGAQAVTVNPSYHAIQLISGVVKPGSARLATSVYHPDIDAVAYEAQNGATLLLLNRSERELPLNAHVLDYVAKTSLPAMSLTAMTFTKE